jgi:hypothetical protein
MNAAHSGKNRHRGRNVVFEFRAPTFSKQALGFQPCLADQIKPVGVQDSLVAARAISRAYFDLIHIPEFHYSSFHKRKFPKRSLHSAPAFDIYILKLNFSSLIVLLFGLLDAFLNPKGASQRRGGAFLNVQT